MLDRLLHPLAGQALKPLAQLCIKLKIHPNLVTLIGLGIGVSAVPFLIQHHYQAALLCVLGNRLFDGLDGAIARQGHSTTPYGAYLDIVCDMLFYGAFVFGMALSLPDHAIWSALLLFSFLGTSSSFLAYAALKPVEEADSSNRGLFFLGGLIEGSETIGFFVLCCLMPYIYPTLAIAFSALCFLTTLIRLVSVRKKLVIKHSEPA